MHPIISFLLKVAVVIGGVYITHEYLTPLLTTEFGNFRFLGVIILILIYLVILGFLMDGYPIFRKLQ